MLVSQWINVRFRGATVRRPANIFPSVRLPINYIQRFGKLSRDTTGWAMGRERNP